MVLQMDDQYDAQVYSLASGWFTRDDEIFIEENFVPVGFSLLLLVVLIRTLVCENNLIFGEYDF
jgi:hypothetical protein